MQKNNDKSKTPEQAHDGANALIHSMLEGGESLLVKCNYSMSMSQGFFTIDIKFLKH